ncbi:hypothetical protein PSCICG_14560 [Pseudomonas cichorii]|nr:hypothetical protein PSCICG_14560 [Pseudomonas cichorii]
MGSGSAPASRGSLTSQSAASGLSRFKKAQAQAKAEKVFATVVRAPQNATLVKAEWRH